MDHLPDDSDSLKDILSCNEAKLIIAYQILKAMDSLFDRIFEIILNEQLNKAMGQ